jgi:transcriptional regulator with XRE-family HTH domain
MRRNRCIFRDSEKVRAVVEMMIKRKGLSQKELSLLSGVDIKQLNRWINRWTYSITQEQLISICDVLGIELDVKITLKE